MFLANIPIQAELQEQVAGGIFLRLNANKMYMCFNREWAISILNGGPLKFVDKFTYLGSSVSSTESDINLRLAKAWTAIYRLSIMWKSDLSDKITQDFFQVAVVSILLYGCTTRTLTKHIEKKLNGNCTRMLRAISNKFWKQYPMEQQLYGHLLPISKNHPSKMNMTWILQGRTH